MSGSYLLDSSVAIRLLRGSSAIAQHVADADAILLSSIVLGELYLGAALSNQKQTNLQHIEQLASICMVVDCDAGTARLYGEVKAELKRKGRPIPENDIWIVAHAIQHDVVLVARDQHFSEIDGLKLQRW